MKRTVSSTALPLCVVGAALLGAAGQARSQPTTPDEQLRPWAENVPAAAQEEANRIFEQGNRYLRESFFMKAVEMYREALRSWDHPGIHYNLALALRNLDQPLAVYEALEKAMQWGEVPLGPDKYRQAERYREQAAKRLAWVELRCPQDGVEVTMDSERVCVGPGQYSTRVLAGPYTIVATGPGYVAHNETRRLPGGTSHTIEIRLATPAELTRYRRRWHWSRPLWLLGGAVAAGAMGGLTHRMAARDLADFERLIERCGGCEPTAMQRQLQRRYRVEGIVAYSAYAVGAALLASAVVTAYVNRARPFRIDEEENRLGIAPVVSGDAVGASATIQF